MDEQELGRLLRGRALRDAARTWRCPSAEQLAGYADGRVAGQEHGRLQAHLADCDYCVREVAALARLGDLPTTEVPPPLLARAREFSQSGASGKGGLTWGWTSAAAVTAGMVVAASLWVYRPEMVVEMPQSELPAAARPASQAEAESQTGSAAPDAAPETQEDGRVRNRSAHASLPVVVFPKEDAVVDATELKIRWTAVPQALFYDVRVLSAEGDLLWEQRVDGIHVQVPPATLEKQQSKMYVSVRAHLSDGRTRKSPVVGFSARRVE